MARFLREEWAITVSQPTLSRLLKENKLSRKHLQRVGHTQSQILRNGWKKFMLDVTAE